MQRIVGAGFASGVALFFWRFLSWVVLPWHNMTFRELPGEERVVAVFKQEMATSGTYVIPWFVESAVAGDADRQAAMSAMAERHERGPIATIFYHAGGAPPMAPGVLAAGVAIDVVIGLFAAALVSLSLAARPSFLRRVAMVVVAGAIAVFLTHVTDWNFMYRPLDYTIVMCLDNLVGAFIVGVVVAAFLRPRPIVDIPPVRASIPLGA